MFNQGQTPRRQRESFGVELEDRIELAAAGPLLIVHKL